MSELTQLFDHARRMAKTTAKTEQSLTRELQALTPDSDQATTVREWADRAGRETRLWNQIADEIDKHLARPAPDHDVQTSIEELL